jgi:hypothetical protein
MMKINNIIKLNNPVSTGTDISADSDELFCGHTIRIIDHADEGIIYEIKMKRINTKRKGMY